MKQRCLLQNYILNKTKHNSYRLLPLKYRGGSNIIYLHDDLHTTNIEVPGKCSVGAFSPCLLYKSIWLGHCVLTGHLPAIHGDVLHLFSQCEDNLMSLDASISEDCPLTVSWF